MITKKVIYIAVITDKVSMQDYYTIYKAIAIAVENPLEAALSST